MKTRSILGNYVLKMRLRSQNTISMSQKQKNSTPGHILRTLGQVCGNALKIRNKDPLQF